MKRDMVLIRTILLELEKQPPGINVSRLGIKDYDVQTIAYHAVIMADADLLEVKSFSADSVNGYLDAYVERITWSGHDFLDSARNENNWKSVLGKVAEKAGSISFVLLKVLLSVGLKEAMGK